MERFLFVEFAENLFLTIAMTLSFPPLFLICTICLILTLHTLINVPRIITFLKKNVADIDYTYFFHEDEYIDQMMEVIYYSFHHYGQVLKIFISTSAYLMDTNRVCYSYSSGPNNYLPICQNCDPHIIRKFLIDIRNVTFENFNDRMSMGNYKFYRFRRVQLKIRSSRNLRNTIEF